MFIRKTVKDEVKIRKPLSRVGKQRSVLDERKERAIEPEALLSKEGWARRPHPNDDRHNQHDRRGRDEDRRCDADLEQP